MNSIYLDCSGLHSIRVDSDGLPHSIYIDGQDFINRLNEAIDRIPHPITLTCEELKKQLKVKGLKEQEVGLLWISCILLFPHTL